MIILAKNFKNINDVRSELTHIPGVNKSMKEYMDTFCSNNVITESGNIEDGFDNYDAFIRWAIFVVTKNLPSPFNISYPSCYGLNLGSNFFTLRFPGNFGVGIKVDSNKNDINYEVNFIFYGNDKFVKETKEYNSMISDGWDIKPNKNHK